jgi:hypothetical protein
LERASVIFVAGAVGFNALATFPFRAAGAGNSGATFFPATSVAGLLVTHRRELVVYVATAVAAAGGAALIAAHDAHGIAILAGRATGAFLGATVVRTAAVAR